MPQAPGALLEDVDVVELSTDRRHLLIYDMNGDLSLIIDLMDGDVNLQKDPSGAARDFFRALQMMLHTAGRGQVEGLRRRIFDLEEELRRVRREFRDYKKRRSA